MATGLYTDLTLQEGSMETDVGTILCIFLSPRRLPAPDLHPCQPVFCEDARVRKVGATVYLL